MRVHHLALRADDVAKLADFYERLVGLPIERRNLPRSIWLRAGDTLVMIEQRAKGEPPVDARTKELVAFSCRPTERGAIEARLVAGGVPIEEETDFTLYFRDPEGRRIALSHYPEGEDPPRASWRTK